MNETEQSEILSDQSDRICTIRINRPGKKNALTNAMYTALGDAVLTAAEDREVRVIVLAGHAEIFSSGNDLQDFLKHPPVGEDAPVWRFLKALINNPKPVVAAVNGIAIGVGTTMLLHCDFVIAGDNAVFQMPFVNIGVCPEAGSSMLFPQLLGHRQAAELLMLGERFDGVRAVEFGLVNRVVAADETEAVARQLALRLVAQPPNALRTAKRLMKQGQGEAIAAIMQLESDAFVSMLAGGEAREAMTAFVEKRRPDFSSFD